jgi:hypothetical protein
MSEHGGIGGEAHIAQDGEVEASSHRGATNGCDSRLGEMLGPVVVSPRRLAIEDGFGRLLLELARIESSAERWSVGADDHNAHCRIVLKLIECSNDFVAQSRVEGVPLPWPIEDQRGDRGVAFEKKRLVWHVIIAAWRIPLLRLRSHSSGSNITLRG